MQQHKTIRTIGPPRQWLGAIGVGLALLAAACADNQGAALIGPTATLSGPMAAHPPGPGSVETLPLPVVVANTSTCGSVTIQWTNSTTATGHTAQMWQVQVSGTDATNFEDPLSFDSAQYASNSLTLPLESGTYLVRVRAKSNEPRVNQSGFSAVLTFTVTACQSCTFTQGYWKNHSSEWPVDSLLLGSVSYTAPELLDIFTQPVAGNGLISLAHQLIAAKLNVANGAGAAAVAAALSAADALIGSLQVPPVGAGYLAPSITSGLVNGLDAYNSGVVGPGHCE